MILNKKLITDENTRIDLIRHGYNNVFDFEDKLKSCFSEANIVTVVSTPSTVEWLIDKAKEICGMNIETYSMPKRHWYELQYIG